MTADCKDKLNSSLSFFPIKYIICIQQSEGTKKMINCHFQKLRETDSRQMWTYEHSSISEGLSTVNIGGINHQNNVNQENFQILHITINKSP